MAGPETDTEREIRPERFTVDDADRVYLFSRGICVWPDWLAGKTKDEVYALTPAELVAMKPREIK